MQKTSTEEFFERYGSLFQCPQSGADLLLKDGYLENEHGVYQYKITDDAIPLLFNPKQSDATSLDSQSDSQIGLSEYSTLEDTGALIDYVRKDVVARLMDEQIPWNAKILEIGCGIGQLSNFLSVANRIVIGADSSYQDLRVAQEFKKNNGLKNALFVQMNLFQPCFKPESFDVVFLNAANIPSDQSFQALETSARLVKPGGYLLIRLFHTLALRSQQPHTVHAKHTFRGVLPWLNKVGLHFINSIPKSNPFEPALSDTEQLFTKHLPGNYVERALVDIGRLFAGHHMSGFFIIIAQK